MWFLNHHSPHILFKYNIMKFDALYPYYKNLKNSETDS